MPTRASLQRVDASILTALNAPVSFNLFGEPGTLGAGSAARHGALLW